MVEKDSLYIVPKRDGRTRRFIGYEVKDSNGPVLGKDGKPVVLKEQKNPKFYTLNEKEDSLPAKNAPDGIYALSTLDADNHVFHYEVKYKNRSWKITEAEHNKNKEPELIFIAKGKNKEFLGYTIHQYDENAKKVVSRGMVSPENVTYRRRKDGRISCIYKDPRQEYHIETISSAEFDKRPNAVLETSGNALMQSAENITQETNSVSPSVISRGR